MKEKNKIIAIAGTIVFHLLIILILYLGGFFRQIPEEEGGIEVMQGYVDEASGTFRPDPVTPELPTQEPQQPQTSQQVPNTDNPLITQNTEESLEIKQKKEEQKKKQAEELRQKQIREQQLAEQRKREEEEKRKADATARNVANAFNNSGNSSNNGTGTSGSGLQGSTTGNSNQGAPKGIGYGYGLEGFGERGIRGGFIEPRYKGEQSGRIRFYLTVDSEGKVLTAEFASGTTITDAKMRESAKEAIMRQRFDVSKSEKQAGYFIYKYDK